MKSWIKKLLIFVALLIIVAQFFQPIKNNGSFSAVTPFFEDTNATQNIKTILSNACLDCHSNSTRYPWYSNITPLNYWIANHINEGKKELNLSKWNDYSNKRKDHKLEEVIEEIKENHMPLSSYTFIHRDAKLSKQQIEDLVNWAKQARTKYLLLKQTQ